MGCPSVAILVAVIAFGPSCGFGVGKVPTVTGKGPPWVAIIVVVVTHGPLCRCRVLRRLTATGMFSSRLKSATSQKGLPGGPQPYNPCSTLHTCEHLLRSTNNLPLIRLKQFIPDAIALLRLYRKLALSQQGRPASSTGTTGRKRTASTTAPQRTTLWVP